MAQMHTRQRRQVVKWCVAHDKNIAATCARFGISRATLYRWLAHQAASPGEPLCAQSRRPHTTRGPAWSRAAFAKLCDLTMAHPPWGRGRLRAALVEQTGISRSPATVGRMLAEMRAQCPLCGERDGYHRLALHVQDKELVQAGVSLPLRPLPPDPEKTALRREKAAIMREAQALVRGHR